jgi:lipopolysaccharide/colanic/teichoic acid biosynthesis glycosyltransferase
MQSIEGNLQENAEVEIVDRYERNISYYIIKRTIDIIGSLCGIILLCTAML